MTGEGKYFRGNISRIEEFFEICQYWEFSVKMSRFNEWDGAIESGMIAEFTGEINVCPIGSRRYHTTATATANSDFLDQGIGIFICQPDPHEGRREDIFDFLSKVFDSKMFRQ